MDERRYLIVGGSGYFGARLAEALRGAARVTITRRSSSPARDTWIERAGIEAVHFDSAEGGEIPVGGRFDAVINLAMPGATEAARDLETGRTRALAAADACLRLLEGDRASRMVHFSTFHVYGGEPRVLYEEGDVAVPSSPYGHIHLEAERLVLANDRVVVVRPSNLVGVPAHADLGDQARLLFLDLCRQAAAGTIRLRNDGLSFRDFLPFEDAIVAVRNLVGGSLSGHRLFNLARGEAIRLDVVARMIRSVAGDAASIEFGTGQDAYREPFTISNERLRALGWDPRASLSDEAARIVDFFRSRA
jgi:nucleoside-diphosphate-sugar epimerase